MKFYAFLAAALIAAAQAKNVLQSQDASQASQAKDIVQKKGLSTPKSTVKYLDISEGLATKYPMPTGNVTIKPTRPDPRETEPPTPASTLPPTPAAAFKLQATPPADAEVLATARKSTDARAGTTTRGLSCTPGTSPRTRRRREWATATTGSTSLCGSTTRTSVLPLH
uniref:RxLR effector protein n=1 Tax=Phytophthora fragariae TaxID=53985 RepID=A0A6A3EUS3_9STRA|nr:hypothetical protein PF009_g14290 [Phytophthora fragariae]